MKNTRKKPEKRMKKTKGGIVRLRILLAVLICAAAFALGSGLSAKYIHSENRDDELTAAAFYFTSDLLSETSGTTYTYARGTGSITVCLYNYADALRTSECEIGYTVTLTKDGETVSTKTGELKEDEFSEAKVTFENLEEGTYKIEASSSPYETALSANFILTAADEDLSYSVSTAANDATVLLTVTTADKAGCVSISWSNEGLTPDTTDKYLEKADDGSVTVYFDTASEYTFRFFKSDISEADISKSDFTVSWVSNEQ